MRLVLSSHYSTRTCTLRLFTRLPRSSLSHRGLTPFQFRNLLYDLIIRGFVPNNTRGGGENMHTLHVVGPCAPAALSIDTE